MSNIVAQQQMQMLAWLRRNLSSDLGQGPAALPVSRSLIILVSIVFGGAVAGDFADRLPSELRQTRSVRTPSHLGKAIAADDQGLFHQSSQMPVQVSRPESAWPPPSSSWPRLEVVGSLASS